MRGPLLAGPHINRVLLFVHINLIIICSRTWRRPPAAAFAAAGAGVGGAPAPRSTSGGRALGGASLIYNKFYTNCIYSPPLPMSKPRTKRRPPRKLNWAPDDGPPPWKGRRKRTTARALCARAMAFLPRAPPRHCRGGGRLRALIVKNLVGAVKQPLRQSPRKSGPPRTRRGAPRPLAAGRETLT